VGRVNSARRYHAMRVAGADSADGTFVAFGPDVNIPHVRRWVETAKRQPSLFAVGQVA
jgi:Xaa-Pro aminopeptidase